MQAAQQDRGLLVLVVSILLLVGIALLFAVAAVGLRVRNDRKRKRLDALEAGWEPLILDYLGGSRTAGDIYAVVGMGDRYFFSQFLYRFITRVRGQEREKLIELGEPLLPLLVAHTRQDQPEDRALAVQLLGVLGFEPHHYVLFEALDDPSGLVAMTATRALARPEHPGFAKILLLNLPRFKLWSVGYLASMLKSIGPAISPELCRIIADPHADPRLRLVATEALGELRDPSAAAVAARIIPVETDANLLAKLLLLLSSLGVSSHLPVIRSCLGHPHFSVRMEAVAAIGALGTPADASTLEPLLGDPSPWVRLHAARAIRCLGGERVLAEIIATDHPGAAASHEAMQEAGA